MTTPARSSLLILIAAVLTACGSPAPTAVIQPPVGPPDTYVFYNLAGTYHSPDSVTLVVSSVLSTPDSLTAIATMADGTQFRIAALRTGDGPANLTWHGELVQDFEPIMDCTLTASNAATGGGRSSWTLDLDITLDGREIQRMVFE